MAGARCQTCYQRNKGRSAERARKYVAEGRCSSCGKKKQQDAWLCKACTKKAHARKTREVTAEYRRQRVAKGECLQCGANHDTGKQVCPACMEKRRRYMRKYTVERRKTDIQYRIRCRLASRIGNAMRDRKLSYSDKGAHPIRDLGCTLAELVEHLESQFQPGMTWDNWGEWHIDHIIPLASFDLTDADQFKRAAHFSNLQPLWAKDNLEKHARTE